MNFPKIERIPKLPTEELLRRAGLIKPVILRDQTYFEWKSKSDPINHSFTWEYECGKQVNVGRPIFTTITFHSWGHPSLFKPSIAEVVAQIPDQILDQVKAFHLEEDDMDVYHCLPDGYHFTKTKFFGEYEVVNFGPRLSREEKQRQWDAAGGTSLYPHQSE